nr:hypothetical protein [Pandoravirus massiliensis]
MEYAVNERQWNDHRVVTGSKDDDGDVDRALDGGSDGDSDEGDAEQPRLHRVRRRRRRRPLQLTDADERRISLYLVVATVAFLVGAMGIGAANYYSPLACFGQRRHIDGADRPYATPADHRHSWIVLGSAFFACGTTSLVAIGFLIVGAIGCFTLAVRISRALACSF